MSGTTPEMTGQNQGAGTARTGYRTVTSVTEVTVVFFVSVHSRRVLKPTRRGPKKLRQLPAAEPDPGAEKAASKIQKKCLAASNISTGARQGGCGGVGGFRVVGSRVLGAGVWGMCGIVLGIHMGVYVAGTRGGLVALVYV